MAIQKSDAIILKTFDFRETSLIINLFTKDFGKVSGLVKGIRNDPQRYGGLPLTFARNHIIFYARPKRELNLVTSCEARDQFLPIRQDLARSNCALYCMELLDSVTAEFDQNKKLYQLTLNCLSALCKKEPTANIARIFEIKLIKLSGFKPHLDACVNCQGPISARAKFSVTLGGILCRRCLRFDQKAQPILPGTLASLNYIEKSSWSKALQLKVTARISQELKKILTSFLEVHLEKEIKSRKFLI